MHAGEIRAGDGQAPGGRPGGEEENDAGQSTWLDFSAGITDADLAKVTATIESKLA